MAKLLDEGKLPAHVDPAAILNAPASKRTKGKTGLSDNFNPSPSEPAANEGVADPPVNEVSQRKRRRSSSTSNSSIDDAVLSGLSDSDEQPDYLIRSSSPSEGEGEAAE